MLEPDEYPESRAATSSFKAKLERLQEMIRNGEELPSIVINIDKDDYPPMEEHEIAFMNNAFRDD